LRCGVGSRVATCALYNIKHNKEMIPRVRDTGWEERFELEADAEASPEYWQDRATTFLSKRHPGVLKISSERFHRKLTPEERSADADSSNLSKRAKQCHPHQDLQFTDVRFQAEPTSHCLHTLPTPTFQAPTSTSTDPAHQGLPGSSGPSGEQFLTWEQLASRMGLPDLYDLRWEEYWSWRTAVQPSNI
jgi:hypothetical protein